jgi:hypothetical protein
MASFHVDDPYNIYNNSENTKTYIFPDRDLFGVTEVTLKPGQSITLKVLYELAEGESEHPFPWAIYDNDDKVFEINRESPGIIVVN